MKDSFAHGNVQNTSPGVFHLQSQEQVFVSPMEFLKILSNPLSNRECLPSSNLGTRKSHRRSGKIIDTVSLSVASASIVPPGSPITQNSLLLAAGAPFSRARKIVWHLITVSRGLFYERQRRTCCMFAQTDIRVLMLISAAGRDPGCRGIVSRASFTFPTAFHAKRRKRW